MIKTNDNHYPVGMMCRALSVSRSGYYGWSHRPLSVKDQANKVLADEIKRVFLKKRKAGRVCLESPADFGVKGRRRPAPHSQAYEGNGLRAKAARKYKATTNSKHLLPLTNWRRILAQTSLTKSGSRASLISGGRRLAVLGGRAGALLATVDRLGHRRTDNGDNIS